MKPEYNPAVDDYSALKMLTPWWDVVIRYLTTGLMTIALSTITLQAAKDNLVCIPAVSCKGVKAVCNCSVGLQPSCSLAMDKLCNDSAKDVMTTMGDRRHYDYIDTVCFHEKLGIYSHYFPFFLVTMAAVLLLASNIWVLYPKTESVLSQFVKLTMDCYNAVGANLNVSESKGKENGEQREGDASKNNEGSKEQSMASVESLHDKVDDFMKLYTGNKTTSNVYIFQAVIESVVSLSCLIILVWCSHVYNLKSYKVDCKIEEVFNIPYQSFKCTRFVAPYYYAVMWVFVSVLIVILALSLYALIWAYRHRSCKNIYAASNVSENCNIEGDLAFLYYLLENYNQLYLKRLARILCVILKENDKSDNKDKSDKSDENKSSGMPEHEALLLEETSA